MTSQKWYQQNPGQQKQSSWNRYYKNRDAILYVTKDKFLKFHPSHNEMDKLKIALNKENKRHRNKDYKRNHGQILFRLCPYNSFATPKSEAKEYNFTKIREALY
uniref:Uncharacterized protein n=1 Tax=Amphimedon queenslandica TaxID=400682 RepID=A0A1X7UMB6_AMPQE